MNDWLSYKASGSAKNNECLQHASGGDSGYLEHAMTLKQLLTREGVKEFLSTNQLNRTKAWAATIETLSEAANKMVSNLNNFPKATNIKGLTESKKIVEQSSRLYKYIEDYKGELNDYTVEITEIIFNKLSEKYSDLSSVTDGLKQARDSLNEMGKVMTYTINAFKNNCDVVMSGFKIEQKALEKQRNAFTNSKLREEYQRRIDALNQSIKTVENMKSEVEGLKHSFEDDSEYLEHWGVKGMKWGHHNQQEEKQSEANKRLEEASVVLSMKTIHERSCKDLEKSQDEHGRAIAEYENKLNTFERALDAYNKAKPEQKDGMYNALQTVWGQLEKADKNLRSAEDSLRHDAEVVKQQLDDVRKANLSPESEREAENALHDVQSKHGIWNYKITLGQIDKRNPMVERHNYLRARFNTIKDSKGAKHVYN